VGHDACHQVIDLDNIFGQEMPDEKIQCKFTVIGSGNGLNLVLGRINNYPYHATLVRAFCDRSEILSDWAKKPDQLEIFDPSYEVRGGGWLELDPGTGRLRFFGNSTVYGKYMVGDLEQVLSSTDCLDKYRVMVEQ